MTNAKDMEAGLGPSESPAVLAPPAVPGPDALPPDALPPDGVVLDAVVLDVMGQLALIKDAAGPGGLSGLDSEGALRVVEAVEVVKAWADSVSVAATAVLVAELESDFADLAVEQPSAMTWTRFFRSCRSAVTREIQVATGLPVTACARRVWLAACEPQRVGAVLDLMRLGRVSFARALTLAEATAHLDAFTAAAIAARVLRPLTGPDGAPLQGMAPLSQATFNARLRTQLVLHDGLVGQAERTYQESLRARDARAEGNRDGTGSLIVTGDGARIAAAAGRVDRIARRLRTGGDPRTLAQLRADVATDLLLRGWIPNDPTFTALGQPPAAFVNVVVSLTTLLGVDAGVGQIPGWGALTATQARKLAMTAGSIWTRIVTDPLTGRAIEATAGTYRVPAAMATQIKIRDGVCRAPGCEIPASMTDLDHSTEWAPHSAGGPTAETNLAAVHRGHHNLKTTGFWDSTQNPDGTICWTTATGRTITTYPYIYDHPDNQPINHSPLEARFGRRIAAVINPDIPLPGHLNILDHIGWAQDLTPTTPPPHTPATAQESQKQPTSTAARTPDHPPPPF